MKRGMDARGGKQDVEAVQDLPVGWSDGEEETLALGAAVEQQLGQIVDAVLERELGGPASQKGRRQARQTLIDILQEALLDLVQEEALRRQSLAPLAPAMAVGDAAQAGMDVARRVQELGFVEFTAGLINGTFDAIIGATVKQMDAYAKLVAELSKTLAQFQAENVSDAQINAHLAQRYPDGAGGTVVRTGYRFVDTAADPAGGVSEKSALAKLLEVVDALIAETARLRNPDQPLSRQALGIQEDFNPNPVEFTDAQIVSIRQAIALTLATSMLDHLRAMAREGMARIVVTNGKIRSRLTFSVSTSEQDRASQSQYQRQSAGAYVRGSAWAPWGSVTAGASWSKLNVNTVDPASFDSLTMSTEIIGEVEINFKTETFPAVTTSQA